MTTMMANYYLLRCVFVGITCRMNLWIVASLTLRYTYQYMANVSRLPVILVAMSVTV